MNLIKLYKFLTEEAAELRWEGKELLIWLYHFHVEDFIELIGEGCLDEGGLDCKLQGNYLAFDIVPICQYHGINPIEILEKAA